MRRFMMLSSKLPLSSVWTALMLVSFLRPSFVLSRPEGAPVCPLGVPAVEQPGSPHVSMRQAELLPPNFGILMSRARDTGLWCDSHRQWWFEH